MERLNEPIWEILEELQEEDFEKFKWRLQQTVNLEGCHPIAKGHLKKANTMDTVDLIMQTYPIKAAMIVSNVLKKMNRNDLLKKIPSEFLSGPPAAAATQTLSQVDSATAGRHMDDMRHKESQLQNITKEMEDSRRQQHELTQDLQGLNNQIEELTVQLNEKESELDKISHRLTETDKTLGEKDQLLKERQSELEKISQMMIEKDKKLGQKDQLLKERESELWTINQRLIGKKKELGETEKELQGMHSLVEKLTVQLKERESQLGKINQTLIERDKELGEKDQLLEEREGELKKLKQGLIERDQKLGEKDQLLNESYRQQTETHKQMQERESDQEKINQRLTERDNKPGEKDKQLKESNELPTQQMREKESEQQCSHKETEQKDEELRKTKKECNNVISENTQHAQQKCDMKTETEKPRTALAQTEKGFSSALSSNTSPLRELDSHVALLPAVAKDPHSKTDTLSVDHGAVSQLKPDVRKYVCEITLDPNTAHKELSLSENNRKVTNVGKGQMYPHHPDRFTDWHQVMCREGLTGRSYWEVEWSDWVWIAMTYRGIKRWGGISLFGSNDQSWCLVCNGTREYGNKYSVSHNEKETALRVRPSSRSGRVGVYLDWPAGTLTFYGVSSDTLTHLYTFQSTFTGPLYPGFRVGVCQRPGSSVSLCPIEEVQ